MFYIHSSGHSNLFYLRYSSCRRHFSPKGLMHLISTNSIDKTYSVLFILFGSVLTTAWANYVLDSREKKKKKKNDLQLS